jgi:hypothetical protein
MTEKKFCQYVKKQQPVTVVDSLMGTGKTSYYINYLNQYKGKDRFIVVVPFISEVERVIDETKGFITPSYDEFDTKTKSLKALILDNQNIVATHELFERIDQETISLLAIAGNYHLICDEVTETIQKVDLHETDVKHLFDSGKLEMDSEGKVVWTDVEYDGRLLSKPKKLLRSGKVFANNHSTLLWRFDPEVFFVFKSVTVMTFLFKGQIMEAYFRLNGIPYELKSVEGDRQTGYRLVDYKKPDLTQIRNLIEICTDGKLNRLGNTTSKQGFDALTFTQLTKMIKNPRSKMTIFLKNGIYNYLNNKTKAKASTVMWTCPKEVSKAIAPRRYGIKGFVQSNALGTNDYSNRSVLCYILNRYMSPSIVNYFSSHGIEVDQELYALSSMLQWIWRSQVRDGKPIKIWVPSSRMRNLLIAFLNNEI